MNFKSQKDFIDFITAVALVLACFLGYYSHSFFVYGYFIFLILLVVNPLAFGFITKRPIMSSLVGFLPLFMIVLYRLPYSAVFPDQWSSDLIAFIPGAICLGIAGFFAAQKKEDRNNQLICYSLSILSILIMIGFYV